MSLRIGFLGAGFMAKLHYQMLRSCPDVCWAGVFDKDRARADEFSSMTGSPVRDSEAEVLDSCDAVFICTWTSEHPRLVESAVERRLAVFCEKPLATDLKGARHIADLVRAAGVVNQVGLVLRFSPAFMWLRHLVADPDSGRVMSIVFRDDQHLPDRGRYDSTWRRDVTKAGSGTLLEHSIHDLDMIESIVGPIGTVSARSSHFHGIEGIEDAVAVSLGLGDGGVGSLVSVWHDIDERPGSRYVEVICENLWCALEGDEWFGPVRWIRTGCEMRSAKGGRLVELLREIPATLGNPDEAFVRAALNARPANPDVQTALRAHVLVDAAYRSVAQQGAPISVPPG